MSSQHKRYRIEHSNPGESDLDGLRPFAIEAPQRHHAEVIANLGELKELVRPSRRWGGT